MNLSEDILIIMIRGFIVIRIRKCINVDVHASF